MKSTRGLGASTIAPIGLGSKIGYDTKKSEATVGFTVAATVLVLAAGGLSLLWFNRFP